MLNLLLIDKGTYYLKIFELLAKLTHGNLPGLTNRRRNSKVFVHELLVLMSLENTICSLLGYT